VGGELERFSPVVEGNKLIVAERKLGISLAVLVGKLDLVYALVEQFDNGTYFPGVEFSGRKVFKQRNSV
jgi:hypothetical protein